MKHLFIFLGLLFFSFSSMAHEDTFISIGENGDLYGLPPEYRPASLKENRITIGKHQLSMPVCISQYFSNPETYELFITSSWYHIKSSLPPYINFNVKPKNKNIEFRFLFSLNDLSLIEFTQVTRVSEKEWNYQPLEVSKQCQTEIKNSTK